jgi:segregation and condensation protein B
MTAEQSLITYLFIKGEPVARKEVSGYFAWDDAALAQALAGAQAALSALGLTLVDDGKELELRTAPMAQALVEAIARDELGRDIGRAGLETLAIILYKGAASRAEIDYVRGVNSSHILRSLSMRGLVRRVPKPGDERSFLYEPTTELLSHLGASRIEDLPEYAAVRANLAELERAGEDAPEQQNEPTL